MVFSFKINWYTIERTIILKILKKIKNSNDEMNTDKESKLIIIDYHKKVYEYVRNII